MKYKRIVVKMGSSSIVGGKKGFNEDTLTALVDGICKLKNKGIEVALVSSGAIAVGFRGLGLNKKPDEIAKKQACAAIGQPYLMKKYAELFEKNGVSCAQILLTHEDFGSRKRSCHLSATLEALFHYGVVPIINENDALTVNEIKVGDNDTLSSMVTLFTDADLLVLVTDVDGLYDKKPTESDAKLIRVVEKIDDNLKSCVSGAGSNVGVGGMITKLKAGQIVTGAGKEMLIINRNKLNLLGDIDSTDIIGTRFLPNDNGLNLKRAWLKYCSTISGSVTIDDGAVKAIIGRKSLLLCGVTQKSGNFLMGEVISILDKNGVEIARGIANINSQDIKTKNDNQGLMLVHADNLGLIGE